MTDPPPNILPLTSPDSTLATTGGKGHNLSILLRDGSIPVPNGYCITIHAYRQFVRSINDKITSTLETLTTDNLDNVSSQIQSIITSHSLPSTLQNELQIVLASFPPSTPLAIRSSATCEDLPFASFAGQHDTYLNIPSTLTAVSTHILKCYASLYTPRAISYRRTNHIDQEVGMAVILQEMIPSKYSGVLFTANPVNGRRNESVVEIVNGLGEALVSGLTEPDRYVVRRLRDGTLTIKECKVGKKEKSMQSANGGGVTLISTPASTQSLLNDSQIYDLVTLGQSVAKLFDSPQDIEFASSNGKNYIVQSRPITTLFPLPKDDPTDSLQIYFSFNAVQGISAPFYPAGEEALNGPHGILGGLIQYLSWGRFGHGRMFQRVAGRLYGNVTNVLTNSLGRGFLKRVLPMAEPGILAGVEEVMEEGELEIKSGMSWMLIMRLISIGVVVFPRYVLSVMFPDRARERICHLTDEIVGNVEKESEGVDGLENVVLFKQRTLKSLFPKVVLHFMPRLGAAMHPLLLLMKLAGKLPDGKNQVLTMTVRTKSTYECWR
jgi:pyruvate,water dikinase